MATVFPSASKCSLLLITSPLISALITFSLISFAIFDVSNSASLFPRDSETRQSKLLDGPWNFKYLPYDDQDRGFSESWFNKSLPDTDRFWELDADIEASFGGGATFGNDANLAPESDAGRTIKMPVPASFNDITQDKVLRDYIGWVWYQRSFFADKSWRSNQKIILIRFDSIHYHAQVYLNGISIVNHTGGHLPFDADITNILTYNKPNVITIAVNNTLTSSTVPQGSVHFKTGDDATRYPPGFKSINLNFDFFNYAGIHRHVRLIILPNIYIHDISIHTGFLSNETDIDNDVITDTASLTGVINYSFIYDDKRNLNFDTTPEKSAISCLLEIYDKQGANLVSRAKGCSGSVMIVNVTPWWPIGTNSNPGYLYTGKFMLINGSVPGIDGVIDVYYQKIGIRSISVTNDQFFINHQPFYFKGFGKHEDADIRGRGLDEILIAKDMNLIKWIGANSFRTSHYPYSEEMMDACDEAGIVVINECPAVGLQGFGNQLLSQHIQSMTELIQRDKNRPSTVMWSIANEPSSNDERSFDYFKQVVSVVKSLDISRPVTGAIAQDKHSDHMGALLDVLMVNRYYSWYSDTGSLQVIQPLIVNEFTEWKVLHDKPIMISEYGAGAVAGLHSDPSFVYSEDYQTELMVEHFKAFDSLRAKGFFIGEHIWNFADFMTLQQSSRVYGNRKGMFTRNRQPKAAARVLKCRYISLALKENEDYASLSRFITKKNGHMYCPIKI